MTHTAGKVSLWQRELFAFEYFVFLPHCVYPTRPSVRCVCLVARRVIDHRVTNVQDQPELASTCALCSRSKTTVQGELVLSAGLAREYVSSTLAWSNIYRQSKAAIAIIRKKPAKLIAFGPSWIDTASLFTENYKSNRR